MARPPSGLPRAPVALSMRASPEWADWVRALAARSGDDGVSALVERLLAEKARRLGHPAPPPRVCVYKQSR